MLKYELLLLRSLGATVLLFVVVAIQSYTGP